MNFINRKLADFNGLTFKIPTVLFFSILMFTMGYLIYVQFSYYWDFLHSDIVADLAFIREAGRVGSLFPTGWAHLNEMRFVYVTTPAVLFYMVLGNVHLSYKLAVISMLFLNVFLFVYLINYEKKHLLATFAGLVTLLVLFSRYTIFSLFSILFVNGSLSTHLATVLFTLGVYMRIRHAKGGIDVKKWVITLVLILAFLQGIQTSRMVILLYAPLVFVEVVSFLSQLKKGAAVVPVKGMIFTFCLFVLNVLGMFTVNRLIGSGRILLEERGLTFGMDIVGSHQFFERIMDGLTSVLNAFGLTGGVALFSYEGFMFVFRMGLLVLVFVLMRQLKRDASTNHLIFTLFVTLLFSVFAQAFIAIGIGERFNFTATTFIAIVVVGAVDRLIKMSSVKDLDVEKAQVPVLSVSRVQLPKMVLFGLLGMLLVGTLMSLDTLGFYRQPNLQSDRETVVDFLQAEGLSRGYGAFWQAHGLTGVSDWEVVVIPFHSNLGIMGQPLQQGVSHDDFFHGEERVFLVGSIDHFQEGYASPATAPLLSMGQRHDFDGGWVVYVFDFNPWLGYKNP